MEFTVEMRSTMGYCLYTIPRDSIKVLDRVREVFPEATLECIQNRQRYEDSVFYEYQAGLDEQEARSSGHFDDTERVMVTVSRSNVLDTFLELKVSKFDTKYDCVWTLDRKRVVEWWAGLGYPIKISQ